MAVRGLLPGQDVEYVAADISQRMIDRTLARAEELGVADQVTGHLADVGDLPFEDASFDLVVTFTGLHCFPDPARAVVEMCRVVRPGGVITGSALMNDTGRRYEPMRRVGRLSGLLGPGCTTDDVRLWLTAQGIDEVTLEVSGPMGYFRGVRAPAGPAGAGCAVSASSPWASLNRWNELLTSSSAAARPTHSAPSTDLPGSRSL